MSQKAGRVITRYIRDASGNVMAVYQADTISERPIYGSSRLGNLSYASKPGYRTVGHKQYELSNHLGNVLAVVSDRIRMKTDGTWTQVLSRTDYYPFGLEMTGRTESNTYRYGFNGKEKDPSGQWNNQSHYDYGFRIYNPTIGKFLSVDPLSPKYPELTPYQFASNTPIQAIDLDGLEAVSYQVEARGMYGLGVISVATSQTVGVIVDFKENLAAFYTPTLGAGAGEGFVLSSCITVFPTAESVKDIKGMGFNAGAFYAVPGVKTVIGGGELNIALNNDFSINKVGNTVAGSFVPGPNIGAGIGAYLEGSYTFMTDVINIADFENSKIFNDLVNDFGINKQVLINVVEDLHNRAKELVDKKKPEESKGLNELLKERNVSSMDATALPSRQFLNKKGMIGNLLFILVFLMIMIKVHHFFLYRKINSLLEKGGKVNIDSKADLISGLNKISYSSNDLHLKRYIRIFVLEFYMFKIILALFSIIVIYNVFN